MVATPPNDCRLHPGIEVRPSPVAGLGLFAGVPLLAGTVVSRLGGRLVSSAELRSLLQDADAGRRPYVDTIAVTADAHLVLPTGRSNGLGNSSCDPNLWWTDAYTLTARRDIAADEEVTIDYATCTADDDFAMSCRCGSALCRGTVTGADWRQKQLQQRYGEHWVPVLLERIRQSHRD